MGFIDEVLGTEGPRMSPGQDVMPESYALPTLPEYNVREAVGQILPTVHAQTRDGVQSRGSVASGGLGATVQITMAPAHTTVNGTNWQSESVQQALPEGLIPASRGPYDNVYPTQLLPMSRGAVLHQNGPRVENLLVFSDTPAGDLRELEDSEGRDVPVRLEVSSRCCRSPGD